MSGVPVWEGNGGVVVRSDLNEPRWAAAPLTQFDSDVTGNQGLYRILVDTSYYQLVSHSCWSAPRWVAGVALGVRRELA